MDRALLLLEGSFEGLVILAFRLVAHLFVLRRAFKLLDFWLNVSEFIFGELELCLGLEPLFSDQFHVLVEESGRVINFLLAVFVDLGHGLLIVKFHACNLILSKLNKPHFRLAVLVVNALLFVHLCRVLLVNACLGLLENASIFLFLLLKFLIQACTLEHRSTVLLLYLFLLVLVCR